MNLNFMTTRILQIQLSLLLGIVTLLGVATVVAGADKIQFSTDNLVLDMNGKCTVESFVSNNLTLLNSEIGADSIFYLRTTADYLFCIAYGNQDNPIIQFYDAFRFRYKWGGSTETKNEDSSATIAGVTQTVKGTASNKHLLWMRECWLKIKLGTNDNLNHYAQIGLIPYQVGRGISLGAAYDATDFLGFGPGSSIDQYAPGIVLSFNPVQERVKILRRLYDQFQKRQDEIAHAIAQEMGMPIAICKKIDVCVGLAHMQCYLDNAPTWLEPDTVYESYKERHVVYFEPHGVIGISIPWNYPFTNFIWAVIQNLVAGNTVVVKHSEYCMLATKLFEQIFIEAQVPVGVCSFVYGKGFDAGNYLMHCDVDRIWFTGSTQTGQAIYQIAAQKMIPATLELGGSAAGIVFDDIDLDLIMPALYFYRFLNSGQTCDGLKRLIVHRSVFEKVVDKLTAFIATQKVGSALDPATVMGPLVNQKQLEGVEAQVRDAVKRGARVVTGGKRPEGLSGAYFEPTVLTNVSRDMAVWAQEVFWACATNRAF